ncbi:unnamed protein product [Ixodes pacificus]
MLYTGVASSLIRMEFEANRDLFGVITRLASDGIYRVAPSGRPACVTRCTKTCLLEFPCTFVGSMCTDVRSKAKGCCTLPRLLVCAIYIPGCTLIFGTYFDNLLLCFTLFSIGVYFVYRWADLIFTQPNNVWILLSDVLHFLGIFIICGICVCM